MIKTSQDFIMYDYNSTLFPMEVTRFVVENGFSRVLSLAKKFSRDEEGIGFAPQINAFASKPAFHLRRTVKLDPVAEVFLYDLFFSNRLLFKSPKHEDRKHFGYRFESHDNPLRATDSYGGFRKAQAAYERKYAFSISFDVASYFNSIRHEDIIDWFRLIGAASEDVRALDLFLSRTASGRSSDCWPQGMYPAKMMGSDFLRIVEEDNRINAMAVIRFLDDFVLFSDDENSLIDDFFHIQKMLGSRGLSVNAGKTEVKARSIAGVDGDADVVKISLLEKRRMAVQMAYVDDFDDSHEGVELDDEERDYIRKLLKDPSLTEEDAELVLSLARACESDVKPYLPELAIKYPHLGKNVWALCRKISTTDVDFVYGLLKQVSTSSLLQEYQIFWFSKILFDIANYDFDISTILVNLYNHRNSTDLSKAKLLEIESSNVVLRELRREHLFSGSSNWMVWASIVGSRDLIQNSARVGFSAIANSSYINNLVFDIVKNPDVGRYEELNPFG